MFGFCQSILATVPESVTGFAPSYSAANEWCAARLAVPTKRVKAMAHATFMLVVLVTLRDGIVSPFRGTRSLHQDELQGCDDDYGNRPAVEEGRRELPLHHGI